MQKKAYFEWMRIIAIALVIFIHLPGYGLFLGATGAKQGIYMVMSMITRLNVPLFFMITGALLFDKTEDYRKIFTKRILRFILVIAIFSAILLAIYYIKYPADYANPVKRYVFGLFTNGLPGTGSYWFMYAYLAMLCMLPFLQRMAKGMTGREFGVILGVYAFIFAVVPILNEITTHLGIGQFYISSHYSVAIATVGMIFFPLMGYWIDKNVKVEALKARHIIGIVAAVVIGIFLSCLFTYHEGRSTGKFTQNYMQMFDYVTAMGAFILIKYFVTVACPKLSEGKISKVVCLIGSLTFGIYLLDPVWKILFYDRYEAFMEPRMLTMLVSFGWVIISMCLGGIVTWGLKKIPGIRKLL